MKRNHVLLASIIFDIGVYPSVMYSPSVTIYFDFHKPARPIRLLIKYKWSNIDLFYPFNDGIKDIFTGKIGGISIKDWVIDEIKENLFEYKGDFIFDWKECFYLSETGKEIFFVKDFETVEKLYRTEIKKVN